MRIRSPKDFWAGAMFVAFGLTFLIVAQAYYRTGTALRMGPGYFPTVLGGLLIALGAAVMASACVVAGPPVPRFRLRPIGLVLVAILTFAYGLGSLGLAGAAAALVLVAALAGDELRWREAAVLALVLAGFASLVFVKALGLPFPLCPGLIAGCAIG